VQFVCCLWRGSGFWKTVARYDERHVVVLASMLRRHGGHDLICVQDGTFDIAASIVMPERVSTLPDYLPKLWLWSQEFHAIVGRRFAAIDLDVVIAGDLGPLVSGTEPIRLWCDGRGEPYNTSLFALDPGAGSAVWTRMTPAAVQSARLTARRWTGDQSWVAHILGGGIPVFGERSGVIQYRPKLHRRAMPAGMLAGFMCGPYEPASEARESDWVRQLWT